MSFGAKVRGRTLGHKPHQFAGYMKLIKKHTDVVNNLTVAQQKITRQQYSMVDEFNRNVTVHTL